MFDEPISNAKMKTQRKFKVLMRIRKNSNFNKLRFLFKTFFEPEFK